MQKSMRMMTEPFLRDQPNAEAKAGCRIKPRETAPAMSIVPVSGVAAPARAASVSISAELPAALILSP